MPLLDDSGWDTPATPVEYPDVPQTDNTVENAYAADDASFYRYVNDTADGINQAFAFAYQNSTGDSSSGYGPIATGGGTKNENDKPPETSLGASVMTFLKKFFGWEDGGKNEFQKSAMIAAAPVIGGILGGIGTSYANTKKLSQERDLAQQQLALSQQKIDLEAKQAANQNLAGFGFRKPKNPVGLINRPVPINRLRPA